MKISVNDQELFTISETKKKVICNDIHKEIFDEDMKRRLKHIIEHKYEQCFKRLKEEWEPKLKARYESLPTDANAFAELIFTQPEYKCRTTRENEKDHP